MIKDNEKEVVWKPCLRSEAGGEAICGKWDAGKKVNNFPATEKGG